MTRFAIICLLFASSIPALAKKPNKYTVYMDGRTDEAALACDKYLIANAKDPDSIKLDQKYNFDIGRVLMNYWMTIYFDGWGRNTYGAVLRHSFTCTTICKRDKPCIVQEIKE